MLAEPTPHKSYGKPLDHRASKLPPALAAERLIGRAEFQAMLGVAQATFERMKARGLLPPAIELSGTCHRWHLRTVIEFIQGGCKPPARKGGRL